ncbi:MAG: hypothetical protein QOE54_4801 [Streptosporangiaceae bacterium]|jgi:hypothetical protein|nr:hypothetical protein [Streptosporangiaceae bacterium]
MRYLRDSDQQALRLAGDLDKAIRQWLAQRGVDGSCTISPYVDPAGHPAVLVKMDAHAAGAMAAGLNELHGHGAPRVLP